MRKTSKRGNNASRKRVNINYFSEAIEENQTISIIRVQTDDDADDDADDDNDDGDDDGDGDRDASAKILLFLSL